MSTATMSQTTLDALVHYLATGEDPHGRIAENLKGEMNFPRHVVRPARQGCVR